jgi:hypothetical protein
MEEGELTPLQMVKSGRNSKKFGLPSIPNT